jgi:hypothetical protein
MTTAGKAVFRPTTKSAREENLQERTRVRRLICGNPSLLHAAPEAQHAMATQAAVIDQRPAAVVIMGPQVVAIAADQALANPIPLVIPQPRDTAAEHRGRFPAVIQFSRGTSVPRDKFPESRLLSTPAPTHTACCWARPCRIAYTSGAAYQCNRSAWDCAWLPDQCRTRARH